MALTIRPDAALREQLDAIARAQGQSVNQYLLSLVRSDISWRQRLANAVGLSWRSSNAELADALGTAVSAPLSDIEQSYLPADPGAAVAYAAGRAAKRSGKPAPTPSGKPAPAPPPKPKNVRADAAPEPAKAQTRSAAPAKVLVSWKEYDALLALRAKRAGTPAPPKGASGACATVWVHATDAELAAVRGGK